MLDKRTTKIKQRLSEDRSKSKYLQVLLWCKTTKANTPIYRLTIKNKLTEFNSTTTAILATTIMAPYSTN